MRLEPMSQTSVTLMAQYRYRYLNVCQRRPLVIRTVHIILRYGADTDSLPMEDFFNLNPNYFQKT